MMKNVDFMVESLSKEEKKNRVTFLKKNTKEKDTTWLILAQLV